MNKTCPKCGSDLRVKNGFMKSLQRYKCKGCGCNYTKSDKQGYPANVKREAVRYYLEGLGFRRIERLLGISYTTVYYWVKELGQVIKEKYSKEQGKRVDVLEFDELCTWVKKNEIRLGSGRVLKEIPKKYWPVILGIVHQKHLKIFTQK
jgi:transposase-like protein